VTVATSARDLPSLISPQPLATLCYGETITVASLRIRAVLAAVAASVALTIHAGDWHYGTQLHCADCHTQHNSENGQPGRSDDSPTPAAHLLRRATAQELCLSCHDGSNASAPDVIEPVSYVSESAAGAFPNSGGIATDRAHHLDNPTPEVPPGGTQPMVLTCVKCHDPHGNANYRNLRSDPASPSPQIAVLAFQTFVANGSNPSQVYPPSNVIYKSGVSAWCGTCHGASDPASDHPVDKPIWGAVFADYTRWTSTLLPRVPVNSPTDNTVPSRDDEVTCLSCHKAHGSPNPRATIFPDGQSLDSACQECHNQ
jgi:hypothetical protein